jgi:aspartyl-tRNA(Asn)/glutamyl-tRNA(Gln) amidotransferase subunit B
MKYEAIIGLEIHVELNAPTKLFCDCPNRPGDEPNQNTCPICLWMPGAIPKLSQEALEKAALACLALNCTIQPESAFDQKVYYYPDLPKGFQLSQHHKPLSRNGWLDVTDEKGNTKRLRIHHVHMEEDVAKLVHETEGRTPISLVDFNRAGSPLIEIVSEPDMRSPHDAMEFLKVLRTQIRYTNASECSLEEGTMRVDANISLRPEGTEELNTKVEVKNMNSIRNVGDAIAYEIERQTQCMEKGEPIVLHTRLWDPEKRVTSAMRGKFSGPCVPDPAVPRIVVNDPWLQQIRSRLPEMPSQKVARFVRDYGLTRDEAAGMGQERDISEFFEAALRHHGQARKAANWIAGQIIPALRDQGKSIGDTPLTPTRFASLLAMHDRDEINANTAKEVLQRLLSEDKTPEQIVEEHGFKQVSDTSALEMVVDQVLAAHAKDVADFRDGNTKVLGFLIGQAMKSSRGKANPKLLKELLEKKLA